MTNTLPPGGGGGGYPYNGLYREALPEMLHGQQDIPGVRVGGGGGGGSKRFQFISALFPNRAFTG